MEEEHRTILRKNRQHLIRDLEPLKILNDLAEIFDEDDRDEVKAESTRKEQVEVLLDMLPRKGPKVFKDFLRALNKRQPHLACPMIDESRIDFSNVEEGIPNQTDNTKRRKKVAVIPDSDNGMSETDEMEGDLQHCEMEFELIRKERQRVNKLLKSSKKDEVEEQIEYTNGKFEELFQGVYQRLDNITGLLEKIAQGKEVEIGSSLKSCSTPTQAKVERKVQSSAHQSSPGQESASFGSEDMSYDNDPEFNVGGVNLIVDIPAKAKKPTLYATALMSHVFTNEEMREGSVEPKESKGKKALDPTKISLIKSIPNQTDNTKRRKKVAVIPDSDNGMSETDEMEGDLQHCEMEFELIRKERQRVNKLLKSSKKDEVEEQIEYTNGKFEELFQGVYQRLDNITGLLEKIAQGKEVEIGSSLKSCSTPTQAKVERKVQSSAHQSSPGQESASFGSEDMSYDNDPGFNVGGVNLIVDIPAKAKKPTLYATALMSHVFTNEEMREGSVEPKESKGKKALDPTKSALEPSLVIKCWKEAGLK